MKPRLELHRAARRRLEPLDRKRPGADVRGRIRVVLGVAAGGSCDAAARGVGCVPSTTVRTVARYRREGEAGLVDHRTINGTRNVDDDVVRRVSALLAGRPSDGGFERTTWTLELLRLLTARGSA